MTFTPPNSPYVAPPAAAGARGNGFGLAALIVGIAALAGSFLPLLNYVSGFAAIAAVVLAIIGLTRTGRPKGTSVAGLILGGVALVLSIVLAIVYTIGFAALGSDSPSRAPSVSAPSASAAPEAPAAPADPRQPQTFSAQGESDSEAVEMSGDYVVAWTTSGDCSYYGSLEGGSTFGEDVFSASTATSGTSHLYNLAKASWHVHLITGPVPECGWTVTFSPN